MYFYNTQTCISTTLKTEQQYLNTATKWPLVAKKKKKDQIFIGFQIFTKPHFCSNINSLENGWISIFSHLEYFLHPIATYIVIFILEHGREKEFTRQHGFHLIWSSCISFVEWLIYEDYNVSIEIICLDHGSGNFYLIYWCVLNM